MMDSKTLCSLLKLKPHPEGGFYRETYRSTESLDHSSLPPRYSGPRCFGTAIYYLLTPETCSHLHRVRTDEIFHFYLGDSITLLELYPDGGSRVHILGQDLEAGELVQHTVPQGAWQGSFLNPGGRFALLGTTVSPGFDFSDFELGERLGLSEQYPEQRQLIERLTIA